MNRIAVGAVLAASVFGITTLPSSARAATVYSANFDADTAGAAYVPTGWTDVINYTTSDTTDSTPIGGAVVAASGAGYPFVDHTTGSGKFVAFTNSNNGPTGTSFDKFLISPKLTLNGASATVSFYAFASGSNSKISLLLSTNGSGNVPNYGAQFTGTTSTVSATTNSTLGTYDNGKTAYTGVQAGDFTTTLLAEFSPSPFMGASTPWTLYTATIPAGLTDAYVAIREIGVNGAFPSNPSFIGIDDFSVATVPEPAALSVVGLGATAVLRRRRAAR